MLIVDANDALIAIIDASATSIDALATSFIIFFSWACA